ncbi:MAG: ACT domain-containing protein [Verrucomicrobia bacterium]|nr:ACT domain-containing protein [Verrucomicrobiota bacterium]MDA1085960.1 ACT domain-containing protein [Verrucomicrobiota bacterium]
MTKSQLTLYLENRPGELARATKTLSEAKINIEGISVVHTTDVSMVQIVVSNSRNALAALKKANIPVAEQRVAVVSLSNRPGTLAAVANRLAQKNVNINYLYATTSPVENECTVIISADDLEAVEAVWRL